MLSIIVATDTNGGIGKDNKLLFHIKEDLQRFKELTTDHTIIMGRKTFESLPNGALPDRVNIVLTRDKTSITQNEMKGEQHKNIIVYDNIDFIIEAYKNSKKETFVIGGGQIYERLLPYCDRIYLTKVHTKAEADTFFKFDKSEWEEESCDLKENDKFYYEFINLKRKVK